MMERKLKTRIFLPAFLTLFALAVSLLAVQGCAKKNKAAQAEGVTVITNVRVFCGHGVGGIVSVAFEDGLISDKTTGDTYIDGMGGFLMPGLVDAHAHLDTVQDLKLSADKGVTSTFAISAPDGIKSQPGHTRIWSSVALAMGNLDSVDDAVAFIANEVANGADYIKVIVEEPARMANKTISREVLDTIVAEAHKNGLLVTVHAVTIPTFQMAVDAGADIMIHIPMEAALPQSLVDQMARQGTSNVPTLVMMEAFANSPRFGYKPDDYKNAQANVRMLLAANVPVMAGSDANNASFVPKIHHGADLQRELLLLVQAGMTPLEALQSATSLPFELFMLMPGAGCIAPGYPADLILIDGNPDENIGDIANTSKVWIDGAEWPFEAVD